MISQRISLSKYISAEEACDWTGKREAELRVAETEASLEKKRRKVKMEADRQEEEPQPAWLK